ncbi:MAG: hypothetical protein BWY99_02918 [Synergistetes bacterium ADurb.BinA166]|nr:MAG: hypothetical protein BWY99_02918 [Synergistetes bacterium ADurb.BinA166]
MRTRASWTDIGVPSASRTAEYCEKTPIPGPMEACARSTGAIEEAVISSSASGSARFSSRRNSLRETVGAEGPRRRQTRTTEEARALAPIPTGLLLSSVRIGHVPVTAKPASSTASRNDSQPGEVVSFPFVSDCLKA